MHFERLDTRWSDNDVYGHVNNVVYYAFFDTAINRWLIAEGGLDVERGAVIGLAVSSGAHFHSSLAYPDVVEAGLRVGHLGTSSVRYELAIFRAGEDVAAVHGHFTHVFVDRGTRRPVPIEGRLRDALTRLAR